MEIIKILVALSGFCTFVLLALISWVVGKDVYDPVKKEYITDREGKILRYIGYFFCIAILIILYIFLF